MIQILQGRITEFWQRAPALFYSLYLFLAVLFALATPWALFFVFLLFWGRSLRQTFLALFLFLAMLCHLQHNFYFPPLQSKGLFRFQITSIEIAKKSFQKGILYKGNVREILEKDSIKRRCCLPSFLYLSEPLSLDHDYWIEGTLYTKNKNICFLKASSSPFIDKKRTSFCKIREKSKKWVSSYIRNHYKGALAAPFLISLTTGKHEDPLLKGELTQIGCAHLLAISGFHFGLIAAFCHFLLKPFLHYKIHSIVVITLLVFYLLFLGKSPSIYRAFVFASCFLLAPLFERRSSAINTLGIAMGICLTFDPIMATDVGFQLSFLATGAIIILYPKFKKWIIFDTDKGILLFFMNTVALNLAVHLALIPLTMLYFHSINLHSLFYNLFFPSLTALTLLLFLSAGCVHFLIPPLANLLHFVNNFITEHFLWIAENRTFYEKTLFIDWTPGWLIALLFMILYALALWVQEL